jgi:hypothetical protein
LRGVFSDKRASLGDVPSVVKTRDGLTGYKLIVVR